MAASSSSVPSRRAPPMRRPSSPPRRPDAGADQHRRSLRARPAHREQRRRRRHPAARARAGLAAQRRGPRRRGAQPPGRARRRQAARQRRGRPRPGQPAHDRARRARARKRAALGGRRGDRAEPGGDAGHHPAERRLRRPGRRRGRAALAAGRRVAGAPCAADAAPPAVPGGRVDAGAGDAVTVAVAGPVAPAARPSRYVGLVTRAIAFGLDAALINAVAILTAAIVALTFSIVSIPEELRKLAVAAGGAAYLLWVIGYFVAFWSTTGQTPGNRAVGIRVQTSSGVRLRPRRALLRFVGLTLAALPLFAGFLIILVDDRRRGLQGRPARTVGVEAADGTGGGAGGPQPPQDRRPQVLLADHRQAHTPGELGRDERLIRRQQH